MKKLGFTLAEVLIVLAILGVVAALTVPSLLQNTKGKEHKAQLKKGISVLNQAVLRSVAIDGLDFSNYDSGDGTIVPKHASPNALIKAQLRDSEVTTVTGSCCANAGVLMADGIFVSFPTSTSGTACIDVNGAAGPNKTTTSATEPKDCYTLKFSEETVSCNDDICKDVARK